MSKSYLLITYTDGIANERCTPEDWSQVWI